MKTKIAVKQDPEKPISVEVMAASIKAIAEGIRKLRSGPLTDRALFLLIQDAAPSIGGKYQSAPVPIKTIRAVFDGVDQLERAFLRKSTR